MRATHGLSRVALAVVLLAGCSSEGGAQNPPTAADEGANEVVAPSTVDDCQDPGVRSQHAETCEFLVDEQRQYEEQQEAGEECNDPEVYADNPAQCELALPNSESSDSSADDPLTHEWPNGVITTVSGVTIGELLPGTEAVQYFDGEVVATVTLSNEGSETVQFGEAPTQLSPTVQLFVGPNEIEGNPVAMEQDAWPIELAPGGSAAREFHWTVPRSEATSAVLSLSIASGSGQQPAPTHRFTDIELTER